MGSILRQCLPLVSFLCWIFSIISNSLLFPLLALGVPHFPLSSISYSVVSFSPPRFFYTLICMVAPFFYESLSLFHTWLTKLINIFDAGTWVSLDLRLGSSKWINGIYIINNVGLKNKGTPLHNSCISLFDHMYNKLRCYYSILIGITIRALFQKGLLTCVG